MAKPKKETRSIWLTLTPDGAPSPVDPWRWAHHRAPEEGCPSPPCRGLGCAATTHDEADAGYGATTTAWRRVPRPLRGGIFEHGTPRLEGRTLRAAGLAYGLDESGPLRSDRRQEPDPPPADLEDEEALRRVADAVGTTLAVHLRDGSALTVHGRKPPTGGPGGPG